MPQTRIITTHFPLTDCICESFIDWECVYEPEAVISEPYPTPPAPVFMVKRILRVAVVIGGTEFDLTTDVLDDSAARKHVEHTLELNADDEWERTGDN